MASSSGKRCRTNPQSPSSSARLATTWLCGEAHAESRPPTGRLRKYASDASSSSASTRPSTLTCRWNGRVQCRTTAARGTAAISSPLRLRRWVWKVRPLSSGPRRRTIRTDGTPAAEAVASAIASAASSPLSRASASHVRKATKGSPPRSAARSAGGSSGSPDGESPTGREV